MQRGPVPREVCSSFRRSVFSIVTVAYANNELDFVSGDFVFRLETRDVGAAGA